MLLPQQNNHRDVLTLDGFWRFEKRNGDGEANSLFDGLTDARPIGVPASWNEQYLDAYNHFDEGWYEKTFRVTEAWKGKAIYVYFGSVCQNAKVWLNGTLLGEHIGPHLPFEFEISSLIDFENENRLTVLADGTLRTDALPPASMSAEDLRTGWSNSFPAVAYDFFPFSGIHRPVMIYSCSAVRVEDYYLRTDSITWDGDEASKATLSCDIRLTEAITGRVSVSFGDVAAEVALDGQNVAAATLDVPNPELWDIGQGNLYPVTIKVSQGDRCLDSYHARFGIREVEVNGTDFLLNRKPVHFKGFGKHEDFDVIGKGLSLPLIIKDFELLKWINANSFRTSHYPYAEEWLEIADELGVLVISESPFVGMGPRLYTDEIIDRAKGVGQEHVLRDRNHPCVVMWSVANEPSGQMGTPEKKAGAMRFFTEIIDTYRSCDSTRPITYAAHNTVSRNPMAHMVDVVCINKYYGWYNCLAHIEESLPELEAELQAFYDEFKKPIILAEFGADAVDGLHHLPEVMFSEEFQSKIVETQYKALLKYDWFMGAHPWSFADFRVGQTLNRVIYNRKGVFTRSRQPKMVAHTLKRLWEEE